MSFNDSEIMVPPLETKNLSTLSMLNDCVARMISRRGIDSMNQL